MNSSEEGDGSDKSCGATFEVQSADDWLLTLYENERRKKNAGRRWKLRLMIILQK